jgi:predicted flavoprotein YhiN
MRCFPVSNVGADVVAMFSRIIKDVVDVRFSQSVTGISHTSGPVSSSRAGGSFSITTTSDTITTDMVVITTGGNAYAHTGSSGDGYALAQALGHTITECGPSLNSFLVAEEWVK